jgi:hypothetical protein
MPAEGFGEWMSLNAFGWLRRPDLDAQIACSGECGVAWECPTGVVIWLAPGREYFLRRNPIGFEIGNEDYVRQNG